MNRSTEEAILVIDSRLALLERLREEARRRRDMDGALALEWKWQQIDSERRGLLRKISSAEIKVSERQSA